MKRSFYIVLLLSIFSITSFAGGKNETTQPVAGYEIFVRSFQDSNGDGIGDLQGIINRLDYLNDGNPDITNDLGIETIWLTPIFESPSYHGYDITNYYAIDPDYGTLDDFKELCLEAEKRGIKIILDLVINHTSIQHPWFQASKNPDSQYRDWYIWKKTKPKGWINFEGNSPWHQTAGSYYYAIFWNEMPDLNFNNPEVVKEIDKITAFWQKKGVGGFRLDAARYLTENSPGISKGNQADTPATLAFWQNWGRNVRKRDKNAFIVGEVWTSRSIISHYRTDPLGLDHCFDFDFSMALKKSLEVRSAKYFRYHLETKEHDPDQFMVPFTANHDNNRWGTGYPEKDKILVTAAAVLLTQPGTPFLYYGEELGLPDSSPWKSNPSDHDPQKRAPMIWDNSENRGFSDGIPWKKQAKVTSEYSVEYQQNTNNSLWIHTAKLIHLRKEYPFLIDASIKSYDSKNNRVIAYTRENENRKWLILANLSNKEETITTESEWTETIYSSFGKFNGSNLPPESFAILQVSSTRDKNTRDQ